jgi:deoxyribonuclease-4
MDEEEGMRIGAHVSAAGGVSKVIERAQAMGCEAVQLFASPPQGWAFKPVPDTEAKAFREQSRQTGIGPAFLHAVYLINLGSPSPDNLKRSAQSLVNYMAVAAQTGAAGVIFHAGSHKGAGYEGIFKQSVAAITEVLARSPEGPWLTIENSAGMGQHIGSRFQEIGKIMEAVASPRVKVCLDTQHAFAAGYDVAHGQGLEQALEELDREIGLRHLVAVHANDSKTPLGSGVDRHENIGDGQIGEAGFEVILAHQAFRNVPFFLEVPGADGKGPDRDNVERLLRIRTRLGIAA